jgi:hypothetical protein
MEERTSGRSTVKASVKQGNEAVCIVISFSVILIIQGAFMSAGEHHHEFWGAALQVLKSAVHLHPGKGCAGLVFHQSARVDAHNAPLSRRAAGATAVAFAGHAHGSADDHQLCEGGEVGGQDEDVRRAGQIEMLRKGCLEEAAWWRRVQRVEAAGHGQEFSHNDNSRLCFRRELNYQPRRAQIISLDKCSSIQKHWDTDFTCHSDY